MGRFDVFEVKGHGKNLRADGGIVAYAGWGFSSSIEGCVKLKAPKPLPRGAKIIAELAGMTSTYWTYGNKLNLEGKDKTATVHTQQFQKLQVEVKSFADGLVPDGSVLKYPFELALPSNGMFPSFEGTGGRVYYTLKITVTWSESLLRATTEDIEVPVFLFVPNNGVNKLLKSVSRFNHEVPPSQEKCGVSIRVPTTNFRPGDSVEADLAIYFTPFKIRMLQVSIRSEVRYLGPSNKEGIYKFPRPLSEINESFALIKVNNGDPALTRKLVLLIDPTLAQPSLESPLISVKTRLQVNIVCDNSESPNITLQVPLMIVPLMSSEDTQPLPDPSDLINQLALPPSPMSIASGSPRIIPRDPLSLPRGQSFSLDQSPLIRSYSNDFQSSSPVSPNFGPRRISEASMQQGLGVRTSFDGNASQSGSVPSSPTMSRTRSTRSSRGSPRVGYLDAIEAVKSELPSDPMSWTTQQVGMFVQATGAPEDVVQLFTGEDIDGSIFMSLTMEDLKTVLNIPMFSHRHRIMKAIQELENSIARKSSHSS
ncbi:hypothetical protein BCR33DRAFT_58632 [Rhizoclosmatium globosum]|uniref:SAM domain-containing protein n=1 Tax=Rhizoclosmatium globosum TaxID=329046 RepID=A0A1Y2CMF0_9FUNG|nr:hypothetical protein BCR33DRAFT_58632 [Rhizoclosmatium globosum]|eukprot:ORY48106.1 hypothetical protein BCR33DRAFT_58632 [Rhizoclosmatium globosum]